jgi:two-component system response regulator (stage 0 sporulation protein A)
MDSTTFNEIDLEIYVTEIMLDIGVPAHLKGYYYLRDAIIMAEKEPEVVTSVTKLMYPVIAKQYKTTDQKVERAIRNAIEISWTRGNTQTFSKLFGYSVQDGRNRPTNSEYIARVADQVRLDIKARK